MNRHPLARPHFSVARACLFPGRLYVVTVHMFIRPFCGEQALGSAMLAESIQQRPTGPSRVATPAAQSNACVNRTSGVLPFAERREELEDQS